MIASSQDLRILAKRALAAGKTREALRFINRAEMRAETARDFYEVARLWLRLGVDHKQRAELSIRCAEREIRGHTTQEAKRHQRALLEIKRDWVNCSYLWGLLGPSTEKCVAWCLRQSKLIRVEGGKARNRRKSTAGRP